MTFFGYGFPKIERCKIKENVCLEERDKELKEPKRHNDYFPDSETAGRYKTSDIGHNSNQYNTGKYISKESDRQGKYAGEFSDKMDPPDRYIDTLLRHRMTAPVEKVVFEMSEKTLVANRGNLCHHDNGNCHHERRIGIGIDGTKICMPIGKDEVQPVEYETEYIRDEYEYEKTPCNRQKPTCIFFVPYEIDKERIDAIYEVNPDIPDSRKEFGLDGSEKEYSKDKEYSNK